MCEANAFLIKDGAEQLVLASVDTIEPDPEQNGYRLVNIFGEQQTVKARIKYMNLVEHKIVFEE